MSQTLQGITFGFFESLPEDARTHLKDILYGDKALTARPDLPWDDEKPHQTVEQPGESEESPEAPVTSPEKNAEMVPEPPQVHPETVTNLPVAPVPVSNDLMPPGLAPAGMPQPMYHPGIPVVPALPQVYGYPCVYPQHGMYGMPVCAPNVSQPLHPEPVHVDPNARAVDPDTHSDNNNKMVVHNDVTDKEASKILAGKTYERRNKKRRPPDYYQKLEAKQAMVSNVGPQENLGTMHGPLGPVYTVLAPNQTMVTTSHQLPPAFHPNIPPPGHHLPSPYHTHPSSPGIQVASSTHTSSSTNHRVMPSVIPPTVPPYGPGLAHVSIPPPFIPAAGAPIRGPPPPSQSYPEPPHPVPVNPLTGASPNVETPTSGSQEPAPTHPEPSADSPGAQDSALRDVYSDSATNDGLSISFGEVDTELRNIDEEKNVFPWDHRNNNVKKSSPARDKVEASDSAADRCVVDIDCVAQSTTEVATKSTNSTTSATQDFSPQSEGATPHSDGSQTSGAKYVPSEESHARAIPEQTDADQTAVSSPSSSAPESLSHAQNMLNQNNSNSPPEETDNGTVPPPAKPKTTSWAGLFRGTSTAESATVIYNENRAIPTNNTVKRNDPLPETVSVEDDRSAKQLGWVLKEYKLSYKPSSLQPRGLINRGNWCYVNATLQALLACAPFYNLLKRLPISPRADRGPTSTPVLDSMVEFVNEFSPMPPMKPVDKSKTKGNIKYDIPTGSSFEVNFVYKMLQVIKYDGFKSGRQEDAEEFLSCVLNGLHDEMVASMKSLDEANSDKINHAEGDEVTTNGEADVSPDFALDDEVTDDGWEQVGPKNKSVLTRATKSDVSPISNIFRGQFRNILSRPGVKESATLQPFFTLQLDIQSEKVATVQDALENLVSREALQGFTCSRTNVEVDASRRTMLEELPPVLVLHLKCFVYDKSGGCQKVVKQVDFSNELEINKDLLSPTVRGKYPQAQRKYRLFAVVKHVGVRAAGGHYTTDVFYQTLGEWLHFDDNHVSTVSMPQVFKFRASRIPYLLYYRRSDLS